jgi:hypothetical protein
MAQTAVFDDLLRAFARGAAGALGTATANSLLAALRDLSRSFKSAPAQHSGISKRAVHDYVQGNLFGQFAALQVERWVLHTIAAMPHDQALALLMSAATAANGDVKGMLKALAHHLCDRTL